MLLCAQTTILNVVTTQKNVVTTIVTTDTAGNNNHVVVISVENYLGKNKATSQRALNTWLIQASTTFLIES